MANVGYSIFGRPEAQVHLVNGLFKEENLGRMMYLTGLTGDIVLEPGESIAIIRQVADQNSNKYTGTTIVSIFQYAESYGPNRPGGFVGSAVCFKGFPHPTLIQKGLFALLTKAKTLIDPTTAKFLYNKTDEWKVQMPEPKDSYSRSVSDIKQQQTKEGRIVVELDGNMKSQLLGVVQGVLSNANFNSKETIIVTENNGFLARAKAKKYACHSFYELMNYESMHSDMNRKFTSFKKKADEEVRNLKAEKENVSNELKKLNQDIAIGDTKRDNLNRNLKELLIQIESNQKEAHKTKKVVDDLKEEVVNLKQQINAGLKQALDKNPDVLNKIVQGKEREWKQENLQGKVSVNKGSLESYFIKPIFVLVYTTVLILGTFTLAYFVLNKSNATPPVVTGPGGTYIPTNAERQSVLKVPPEMEVAALIASPEDRQQQHESVRKYYADIDSLFKNHADSSHADFKEFLSRKWNFAELWDSTDNSGITRPIRDADKNWKEATSLLESISELRNNLWTSKLLRLELMKHFKEDKSKEEDPYFLGLDYEEGKVLREEKNVFKSSTRKIMLKEYFDKPGNVYEAMGLTEDQLDLEFVREHFNWMIYQCSEYPEDNQKDLGQTDKKEHIIPLIEKNEDGSNSK